MTFNKNPTICHQPKREDKDEDEQFKKDKAERQRMAELLAEREKMLSRWLDCTIYILVDLVG